jgi:hypothetical protein
MTYEVHYERLRQGFSVLLFDLSATWPEQDIAYVHDEVASSEFEDALENLIAIGLRDDKGLTADHARQIEALAAAMGIRSSPFLARLRDIFGTSSCRASP